MTSARQPILVIEANPDLGHDITDQLLADGYTVQLLTSAHDAAQFAEWHPPRAAIIGSLGSPRAPLTLLRHIRRPVHDAPGWPADLPVIMLSASHRQADLLRAFDAGADDVLHRRQPTSSCEPACAPSCAAPTPSSHATGCCASAR